MVDVVPDGRVGEATGNRKNAAGPLYGGVPEKECLLCMVLLSYDTRSTFNCLSKVKWWILNHCPPSLDQDLAAHREEESLGQVSGKVPFNERVK